MARHPRWVRKFLSDDDLAAIAHAVREAEGRTSAEIRVHLDHRCKEDALQKAVVVFERLGMHRTADRHGVLIYVAVTDRKLAVIGDRGIHERVGEGYWRRVVAAVTDHFRNERPREGFVHAVGDVGEMLARHFPRRPDDQNELSDQVSIS
jgi:uncharacterized membrane protein